MPSPSSRLFRIAACALAAFAAVPATADRPVRPAPQPPPRRVVVVSWDGAADWVVDKFLAEGKLPNVARLARSGFRAEYSRPAYPSKTAPGHAALWTGAYGDVNGVTGNSTPLLPRAEHTLLEWRSGFDSAALTAEPLWITAARSGKRVVVLSATQAYPPDRDQAALRAAGVPLDRLISFSGFEAPIAKARVLTGAEFQDATPGWTPMPAHRGAARETSFQVADSTFHALVYDDPADPTDGADTVLVRQGSRDASKAAASATVKPAEAGPDASHYSSRFRVSKGELSGSTYFRLFDLSPDGRRMTLYQRGVYGMRGSVSRAETEKYMEAYGGFHDDVYGSLYEKGLLGTPIPLGGDGTAERRMVETVRLDIEFLKRGTRYALDTWRPDLMFHYTPMTDGAGHVWIGLLDPDKPGHDPAMAARIWPYLEAVYSLEDEWLGEIMDLVGEHTIVCLVSDHGMVGTGREFYPNVALEKAGLLARDSNSKIDLARTKACFPPWSDFFLTVNGTDRKGGTVPPAERDAVLHAASEALRSAVDPDTGERVVTGVFRPQELMGLGMGGPAGGDLYVEVAPGYMVSNDLKTRIAEAVDSPLGNGQHGFLPLRRRMQAICFIGGGGVGNGREIPGVRQIDIAPTIARLLGIPPPRDARGRAISEVVLGD